jgi:predicted aspartyl protease
VAAEEVPGLPESPGVTPAGGVSPVAMGITTLAVDVANPADPEVAERLEFTVDSGAVYSVVPAPVLERLRIRPLKRDTFRLANGAHIDRQRGGALFKFHGYIGVADVSRLG